MAKFDPLKETREWHAAVDDDACLNLEKSLKAQGLKLWLAEIVTLPATSSVFRVVAIFDGPDAALGTQRFQSLGNNNS